MHVYGKFGLYRLYNIFKFLFALNYKKFRGWAQWVRVLAWKSKDTSPNPQLRYSYPGMIVHAYTQVLEG